MTLDDLSPVPFDSAEAWERWLADNHADAPEVWLRIAKKGSGIPSVSYAEAVEVALCYGWIDGKARSVDDAFYAQRFTPRSRRSSWSASNRERVARLTEAGRMKPAGLREVERAQSDGRWEGS